MTRLNLSSLGLATIAGLAGFAFTAPLPAQTVTLEIGAAAATPTGELAGTKLSMAPGLSATAAIRLVPDLHLYGGWDWLHFSADESFAGQDRDFEETGYTFGLRLERRIAAFEEALLRLEGGGTYKHVEIEDAAGDLIENSGHSPGFELGAGIVVPLTGAWRISPLLRYRALWPEFELAGAKVAGDLRYGSAELRLSRQF